PEPVAASLWTTLDWLSRRSTLCASGAQTRKCVRPSPRNVAPSRCESIRLFPLRSAATVGDETRGQVARVDLERQSCARQSTGKLNRQADRRSRLIGSGRGLVQAG